MPLQVFHPWKARFEERYGTQDKLLEQVKELLKLTPKK